MFTRGNDKQRGMHIFAGCINMLISSQDPNVYATFGSLFRQCDMRREAVEAYEKAHGLFDSPGRTERDDRRLRDVQLQLAMLHKDSGEHKQALEVCPAIRRVT